MQESSPLQIGKTHVALVGSHPSKALASEDLPAPVGPTITIRGLGSSEGFWPKARGRRVNTNRCPVGPMTPPQYWAFNLIQNLKMQLMRKGRRKIRIG